MWNSPSAMPCAVCSRMNNAPYCAWVWWAGVLLSFFAMLSHAVSIHVTGLHARVSEGRALLCLAVLLTLARPRSTETLSAGRWIAFERLRFLVTVGIWIICLLISELQIRRWCSSGPALWSLSAWVRSLRTHLPTAAHHTAALNIRKKKKKSAAQDRQVFFFLFLFSSPRPWIIEVPVRNRRGSWQAFYWANNLNVHWIGYYKPNNWIWNMGAPAILAASPA